MAQTINSTPLFIKGNSLVLYMLILQKVWNELRKFHSYGLGFEQSHNPKYEQYSYLIHAVVNSSNKWILKSFALILLFSLWQRVGEFWHLCIYRPAVCVCVTHRTHKALTSCRSEAFCYEIRYRLLHHCHSNAAAMATGCVWSGSGVRTLWLIARESDCEIDWDSHLYSFV